MGSTCRNGFVVDCFAGCESSWLDEVFEGLDEVFEGVVVGSVMLAWAAGGLGATVMDE